MSLSGEQILLRVYLRSADRTPHVPTWERLLKAARTQGLAGATVFRGILGFGSRGLLRPSAWSIVQQQPLILEIVDTTEKITPLIEHQLEAELEHGMATIERAAVMMYRQRASDPPGNLRLASLLHPRSTLPKIEPKGRMTTNENGVLLRIFIGESDMIDRQPLYEAIVQKARELGLAGATVLRGSEGFGANSVVHKSKLLEMSSDMPIVIEMVDDEQKTRLLLPYLEQVVKEGMITMEYVVIVSYRSGRE